MPILNDMLNSRKLKNKNSDNSFMKRGNTLNITPMSPIHSNISIPEMRDISGIGKVDQSVTEKGSTLKIRKKKSEEVSPIPSIATSQVYDSDDKISSDVASLFEINQKRRKRRNKKAIKFMDSPREDETKKVAEFGMRSGEWPDNDNKSHGKVWE